MSNPVLRVRGLIWLARPRGFGRGLVAAALLGAAAVGAPAAPAWGETAGAISPEAGILLNFREASLDAVLDFLSEAAGFVVIKDVPVHGRVSIVSRQPVTSDEAVGLLNAVLKDRGYAAVRRGRILRIVPLEQARYADLPVRAGNDPTAIEPSDRLITQVIPLRSVDAVKLRDNLAPLVPAYAELSANASSNALILTDTEANVRRVVEIVQALDRHLATTVDVRVFQLRYATASNVARMINEVFQPDQAARQQQQVGPMGPFRRFGPPQPGAEAEETALSQRVTAAGDDRTNTVAVSGPPEVLDVVARVVAELDSNPAAEQGVFTFRLRNARAANLATVLNTLFSQQYTTTQAAGTRGAPAATRGAAGGAQGGTQWLGPFGQQPTGAARDTAADLAGTVYVVADEDTNALLVMTASGNFDRVREIIAALDHPVPQVLIKVLIAEVTHTDQRDLGVEFSALNLADSLSSVVTDFDVGVQSGGLVVRRIEDDLDVVLRVLQTVGRLEVLSRPYILASDQQESSITVGAQVPFIRDTRVTEWGQTINTIQYEDIGIILRVTPHINPEGLVIMDVVPEVSTLTGQTVPISETVAAPVFAKRSAQSRVAVRDGQTIVIGGLMEDSRTQQVRKVPLLGDIPLLGGLFRRSITDKSKTELLIFLTPHVVHDASELPELTQRETTEDTKLIPKAIAPGAFERHMEELQRRDVYPD